MFRTLGAFLVAPFPVALFQGAVVGLWPKPGHGIFEHPASMFLAVCLYFYISGLVLGVPLWLIVRRRSTRLRSYLLLGLVVAGLPVAAALLSMALRGTASAFVLVYDLMLFGLGGMIAGALFWLIVVRRTQIAELEGTFA